MQTSTLRGVVRGVAFLLLTLLLLLLHVLTAPLGRRVLSRLKRAWCQGTCWLLNIRVTCDGQPFRDCPTLFVANHVSYVDILALGCFVDATFIAKSEVAGWPLFGLLGRRVGTFFVKRHWRQALIQRNALAARMRGGESFILFGEGTSTNGLAVRPFKTSLLSVAEPWILDCPVAVQGITLAYLRLGDGTPVSAENCDLYAWHSDAPFAPHLWNVLKLGGVEVQIALHEPVLSWSVRSRKALGRELRDEIAMTLAASLGQPAMRERELHLPAPTQSAA